MRPGTKVCIGAEDEHQNGPLKSDIKENKYILDISKLKKKLLKRMTKQQ